MSRSRRASLALALGVSLAAGVAVRGAAQAQHADGGVGAIGEDPEGVDTGDGDGGVPTYAGPPVNVTRLLPDGAAPVVTGRGVSVSAQEVYERVGDAPEPVQRAWAGNPALMDELVDRLVADQLLAGEARRLGLDRDPAVRAAVERALIARLRATVINPSAGDGAAVTDDEVRAFYTAHASRFHIPERRRGRVIFLRDRRDAERVLRLAVARRHDHAVNDFRELSRRYNTEPELVRTTGDLRDVSATRADVDPAVRDALFGLREPGDVHPALVPGAWNGARGYYIVRLVSRRAPIDRTLAESTDWVRQRLVLQHRVDAERALVERLTRDADLHRVPAERVVRVTVGAGP